MTIAIGRTSAGQNIPGLFLHPKFHINDHKDRPMDPTLSLINPVHRPYIISHTHLK
jgi:hypothetical protein